MKIAAVQMMADFGNVEQNLKKSKQLAEEAFLDGAEMVILPEFFTTAMGFHSKMIGTAQPWDGKPMKLLRNLAAKYQGIIGGSYIAIRENDAYNTFVLTFPDGSTFFHDKDQPTMWENCYYKGGIDDGVLATDLSNFGVALCWEFVRTRTVKRMINRVDTVIGGSCWWTLPEKRLRGFPQELNYKNIEIMQETPARFAKMLGVHVIHAAHAGFFEGNMPLMSNFAYKSHYLGETQIVDGTGKILRRMTREDGEGHVLADIDIKEKWSPSESIPNGFWIPKLPVQLRFAWWYQNRHGRRYYRKKIRPHLFK
ncbi:MAG: carbon-nitrogen hydrolase family protein [Promethearchaeota archaeon]|nr:MAG: carbon-nitrogen hydrolase family protein [Candidatus Lokiarchaeota archaeon]